jgi:hypothetical protein
MAAAWAQEGPAPLDEPEAKKLIEDVKAKALQYVKDLPNFACVQVTRKNLDPTGSSRHWKLTETVHEEVTYKDGKEEYAEVSPSGKKSSGENRPGWLISPSDFSEAISLIFDPKSKAQFGWTKWDSLRGHRVHEIAYVVGSETSSYTVGRKGMKAAMAGVIDVDADTNSILRIAIVAMNLPKTSTISAVTSEFHFDFVKIGDHYFLVPLKADLQSKQAKSLQWNEVEFREYRKP